MFSGILSKTVVIDIVTMLVIILLKYTIIKQCLVDIKVPSCGCHTLTATVHCGACAAYFI